MSATERMRAGTATPTVNGARRSRRRGIRRGRRRQSLLGWLALAFLALSVVVIAWTHDQAANRDPYLATARPVAVGAVIEGDDLIVVEAAIDGDVHPLAGRARASVVGKVAARSIGGRVLLFDGDMVEAPGPGVGRVVVPVTLDGDRLPGQLRVGDRVQVVHTGGPAAGRDIEASVLVNDGVVFEVTTASRLSDRTVVAVNVAADDAPKVAAAAAEGRVALVLVGRA